MKKKEKNSEAKAKKPFESDSLKLVSQLTVNIATSKILVSHKLTN